MKKNNILGLILIISLAIISLSGCEKYNNEPPRVENPTYMKYKIPDPEPLSNSEKKIVSDIQDEYKNN